jgi:hypothetical protein
MLPNETDFKQSGNLVGEDVKMTFDENSLDFLADVLINLYSDKELAVIREYSTNARDSHIAAGQKRPIEISTPTYLSYNFKVKDYGLGLSKDDIYKIYSKYGASRSRLTNDATGMLGLGSKSALTYSDRFSLIAIKDGIKIMVDIARSESGGGQMSIVSERETLEPNGVEIIVPVSRNNDFKEKAQNFFKFWGKDEVLIDGKPPMSPNLAKVTDKIFLKENPNYYDKSFLVMGGVPYEIDAEQIMLPKGFVAFADIGSVSFTPSREHLHYTQKTKTTLNALKEEYKENIMLSVQKDIDDAKDKLTAIEVYYRWSRTLRNQNIAITPAEFKYEGKVLQTVFEFDGVWIHGSGFYHKSKDRYSTQVDIKDLKSRTIVYGFDKDKLTSYQKRKLGIWADANNKQSYFFFCKNIPGNGWLDDITRVPWSAILDIKIPREAGAGPKAEPSYEMWCNGKYSSSSDLDKKQPIWYSTKGEFKEWVYQETSYPSKWFTDIQFVFVGQNRLNKFHSKYPSAVKLNDALQTYIDNYINAITDKEKALIESDVYERQKFAQLDKSRLIDPDLQDLIDSSSKSDEIQDLQVKWEDMVRISRKINYYLEGKMRRRVTTPWIYDRYPLFNKLVSSYMSGTDEKYWNHLYLYLNAAYSAYKVLKD